jgi:hypothetical protein
VFFIVSVTGGLVTREQRYLGSFEGARDAACGVLDSDATVDEVRVHAAVERGRDGSMPHGHYREDPATAVVHRRTK